MRAPADVLGPDPERPGERPGEQLASPLGTPLSAPLMAERGGRPLRVVVAGGGVAALELVLALHDDAARLTDVTLLTADDEFVERAATVAEPFGSAPARRRPVAEIVGGAAKLVIDRLERVDTASRCAITQGGAELPYDVLVVATGAQMERPLPHALTFVMDPPETMGELLLDLEEGYDQGVAVVVPPGPGWMLPAYELALLTAAETRAMGKHPRIVLVTPEARPLEAFGQNAADVVRQRLAEAGIELRLRATALQHDNGDLVLAPTGERLEGLRVVALPALRGRPVAGLPADADGFVPVDDESRVRGVEHVYAIGDAAAWPLKHGSLAAQQAVAVARRVARAAGSDLPVLPWKPHLEGLLWAGADDVRLRAAPSLIADVSSYAEPETTDVPKVAAPLLSAALNG